MCQCLWTATHYLLACVNYSTSYHMMHGPENFQRTRKQLQIVYWISQLCKITSQIGRQMTKHCITWIAAVWQEWSSWEQMSHNKALRVVYSCTLRLFIVTSLLSLRANIEVNYIRLLAMRHCCIREQNVFNYLYSSRFMGVAKQMCSWPDKQTRMHDDSIRKTVINTSSNAVLFSLWSAFLDNKA